MNYVRWDRVRAVLALLLDIGEFPFPGDAIYEQ